MKHSSCQKIQYLKLKTKHEGKIYCIYIVAISSLGDSLTQAKLTPCVYFLYWVYFLGTGRKILKGSWKCIERGILNVIKSLPKYFILGCYFCFLTLFTAKGSTLKSWSAKTDMLPKSWINFFRVQMSWLLYVTLPTW